MMNRNCLCLCHTQANDRDDAPASSQPSSAGYEVLPGGESTRSVRAISDFSHAHDFHQRLRLLRRTVANLPSVACPPPPCSSCGCERRSGPASTDDSVEVDYLGRGLRLANVLHQGFSSTVCLVEAEGPPSRIFRHRADSDMTYDMHRRKRDRAARTRLNEGDDMSDPEGDRTSAEQMSLVSEPGPDDATTASGLRPSRSYSNIVVKIVHKDRCDPEELTRCERESRILSEIQHPNIIPLLQSLPRPAELLMFFQHAPHGDLQNLMENRTIPEFATRRVAKQMCSALRYLHANNIVHCDVKPHNMLVYDDAPPMSPARSRVACTNGASTIPPEVDWRNVEVKLGDFGLAQILDPATRTIHFDGVRGSHGYIAPEVLEMKDYDGQIDVFALGVVIYTMLVAYEPFYPPSRCMREEVPFDPRYWSEISPECKDFLSRALTSNPATRISSEDGCAHPWFKDV